MEKVRCLIIGSGPAGYTAAIYVARAGIKPVLYQGLQPGGQLTTTNEVDNYPGYAEGITGPELMEDLKKQAERFETDVRQGIVTDVDFSKEAKIVTLDDGTKIEASTIVIATGSSAKYLGLPDETKYKGEGVSACATCDGFFYKKKNVAVVGGGNTACEEALYLSAIASKVYMIIRKDYMRAEKVIQDRVFSNPKIEVLFNTNTLGLFGENGVEGAHLVRHMGESNEEKFDIKIDGFFLAIGHTPNTKFLKGQIELDDEGYIVKPIAGRPFTSVEGVFVAGDVADPLYKQAVTAAASGCQAAKEVEKYLNEKGL